MMQAEKPCIIDSRLKGEELARLFLVTFKVSVNSGRKGRRDDRLDDVVDANWLPKSYAAMKIPVVRAPHRLCAVGLIAFAIVLFICSISSCQRSQFSGGLTRLKPCRLPGIREELLCGKFTVFENRQTRAGRKIDLNVVVLPAFDQKNKT